MSERPIIGVVMQTQTAIPGERPAAWLMSQRYVEVLRSFGAIPWLIPLLRNDHTTLCEIFQRIDGLFLAGGSDVEPSQYGESPTIECGAVDPDRDATEIFLIRKSLEVNKPVFGICRGIQIINVACGGTLYQDIATQVPGAIKHDFTVAQQHLDRTMVPHDVTIKSGTRLGEILGTPSLGVNSIHHQAIKDLGQGLIVTAYAPDGIIEAVEGPPDSHLLAVQWHPEELTDTLPIMRNLFLNFIQLSAELSRKSG